MHLKSIASLLTRAKTLKRYGSRTAATRQLAKIIEHPDFETLCSILDSFQKLSFVLKANEEVVDDYELVEDLNEQDVLDLDLDVSLDHDTEEADAHGDDILLVDDLIEDSDPSSQTELEELLECKSKEDHEDKDFEIILDEDLEESTMDTSRKTCGNEVEAKLVKAKLAASPKKIVVSKASILAKKKSFS